MRTIKAAVADKSFAFLKLVLPKKYFDDIFIANLLKGENLKIRKLKKTLWCFKHGFLPFEYIWYDLDHNDYKNYVPIRVNYQKRSLNGNYSAILGNKLLFEKHLKTIVSGIDKLNVIESIAFIENGFLLSFSNEVINGEYSSLLPVLDESDLVLKPVSGDGGEGMLFVSKHDDHFAINKEQVSWNPLVDILKNLNGYLIQNKFPQKGFSNEIFPLSVNTMRIATMIDPVTQKPFIAYAVHRFGSAKSGFMDNVNQGGITAMIDLVDGTLSKGIRCSFTGEEKEVFESHPSTLVPIYNIQIPDWKILAGRLTEMAGRMPYLKYVGWDVILSDGELFVLEGNVSPGLGLIQMFRPMREFPDAWNFFKHYKYV